MVLDPQHKLVLAWIEEHGSILPAKMAGVEYLGEIFGSETSKRCRELRQYSYLRSEKDGKFVRFFKINQLPPLSIRMTTFLENCYNQNQLLSKEELVNTAVSKGYKPVEVYKVLENVDKKFLAILW